MKLANALRACIQALDPSGRHASFNNNGVETDTSYAVKAGREALARYNRMKGVGQSFKTDLPHSPRDR